MGAYSTLILGESSLVAYWHLGDAGSTAVDSKGSNTGTYTGSPAGAASLLAAETDGSHDFDGSTQNVAITGTSVLQPTDITVEAWVNIDAFTTNDTVIAVADDCFQMLFDGSGHLVGNYWDGGANRLTTGTTALSTGTTYHLAYTMDDTANLQTVYINGVSNSATGFANSIGWTPSTYTSRIGSGSGGLTGNDVNGRIDEAAVYNTALSAATLLGHYNAGITAPAAAPGPALQVVRSNLRFG
jgi:hypothetical protein